MFVARSVIYYSGTREFHIYIVEIKYKDYGDPVTTMLLKAISIGLQYRFMFLEGRTSEFSPNRFNATLQQDLRVKIAEMTQQLDFLLWCSHEAGLDKPESIAQILGDMPVGELDRRSEVWENAKRELYAIARKMLAAADDRELLRTKVEFQMVLQSFCESTRLLNEDFTAKVLIALGRIVSGDAAKGGLNEAAAAAKAKLYIAPIKSKERNAARIKSHTAASKIANEKRRGTGSVSKR